MLPSKIQKLFHIFSTSSKLRRYSPRLQRDLGAVQRLAPKGEGFGSAARRNERGNGAGEAREKLGETGENQGKQRENSVKTGKTHENLGENN